MESFKKLVSLCILIGIMTTIGCASIVSKSTYPVSVTSRPSGANISITNKQGKEVHAGTTPATISLKASSGYFKSEEYTVTFIKPGFKTFATTIKADLDGWYVLGNIFIGGLIGWLVVDPATGAMWKLDDASVILLEDTIPTGQVDRQLNIALIDDVSKEYYKLLERVE